MISAVEERRDHFRTNCLAWTALNHFLPADLLRELSCVLVEDASANRLSLESLFDESLSESQEALASWIVRPLQVEPRLGQYLQNRIRCLVWANDGDVYFDPNDEAPSASITPKAIENALRLGRADLSFARHIFDPLTFPEQHSIRSLTVAIDTTRQLAGSKDRGDLLKTILDTCKSFDMPLAAVAMKHLGDLV
jgi:hypothetical protein